MSHPDLRVRGNIFATLWPKEGHGVVKLTREQQESLTDAVPAIFAPVPSGWGRRGATTVRYQLADEATVRSALVMAWRNTAPKRLVEHLTCKSARRRVRSPEGSGGNFPESRLSDTP